MPAVITELASVVPEQNVDGEEDSTLGEKCVPEDLFVKNVDPLVPPRLFLFLATPESLCVLSSHPEGDQPEYSVWNGNFLLAESVLQVVVVGVGVGTEVGGPLQGRECP